MLGIPDSARQDPTFFRSPGVDVGRDGCRVPLPWSADGSSFGFSDGTAHLLQPEWFADFAAAAQDGISESTLELYRSALRLRTELQASEQLEWLDAPAGALAFARPGGWICITNIDADPIDLPAGDLLLTSGPLIDGRLPEATTAWLKG